MKYTINIASKIGNDIRTRSFFRRDMERLLPPYVENVAIDFTGVNFISRSVADEICNLLEDKAGVQVIGMSGDVEKMYEIVDRGRRKPREYPESKAHVYHLNTIQELSAFLESL